MVRTFSIRQALADAARLYHNVALFYGLALLGAVFGFLGLFFLMLITGPIANVQGSVADFISRTVPMIVFYPVHFAMEVHKIIRADEYHISGMAGIIPMGLGAFLFYFPMPALGVYVKTALKLQEKADISWTDMFPSIRSFMKSFVIMSVHVAIISVALYAFNLRCGMSAEVINTQWWLFLAAVLIVCALIQSRMVLALYVMFDMQCSVLSALKKSILLTRGTTLKMFVLLSLLFWSCVLMLFFGFFPIPVLGGCIVMIGILFSTFVLASVYKQLKISDSRA